MQFRLVCEVPPIELATLGAGCFWGVEEIFRKLPGIAATRVRYTADFSVVDPYRMMRTKGFAEGLTLGAYSTDRACTRVRVNTNATCCMGGTTDDPTYDDECTDATGHVEVVEVSYDPSRISYDDLLDVFWQLHDPTSMDDQGPYEQGSQYRGSSLPTMPTKKPRHVRQRRR